MGCWDWDWGTWVEGGGGGEGVAHELAGGEGAGWKGGWEIEEVRHFGMAGGEVGWSSV